MKADLDVIEVFAEEALDLIARSPFRDKIRQLLDEAHRGTEMHKVDDDTHPVQYFRQSNCHGTLFHLLGFGDTEWPRFCDSSHMEMFLAHNCTEKKTDNCIAIFRMPEYSLCRRTLAHSGLYLGSAGGMDTIFHQPDTGREFTLDPIEQYTEMFFEMKGPYFFTVKEGELWVPAPFRKRKTKHNL